MVDDEKLVRRGIIGLIDWEKYGMEVVGDSGNSQETLEFLKREEVDLLFSDLEMPGLSGVPFLQEVKKVRPEIQIVVLTMHQEFELIQQSLRVGILDYITKAQIEGENVDAFMESIRERYRETVRYTQLSERRVGPEEISIWEAPDKNTGKSLCRSFKKAGVSFEKLDDRHLLLQEGVQDRRIFKGTGGRTKFADLFGGSKRHRLQPAGGSLKRNREGKTFSGQGARKNGL
ncbi:MAG: response regulator [Lachnospiraceae bacterium]